MKRDKPLLLFLAQNDWFFRSHRLPIALAAIEAGYDVHLACKVTDFKAELEGQGIRIHPLRYIGGQKINPFREALALIEILSLYRRVQPDLVQHISLRPVLLGSLAVRIQNQPAMVNAVTGLGFLFMRESANVRLTRALVMQVLGWTFRHRMNKVLFQNRDDLDAFLKGGTVTPEQVVMVNGSGVEMSRYHHDTLQNDPPVVLFGARMLRDKGLVELVEAGRMLRERGIACRIMLLGAPDEGNPSAIQVEELKEWNEEGVVEWLGHQDDMANWLSRADIACLPSYREGTPRFLLEAAAASLPIVTTDTPGCREMVTEGENGSLVPVRDAHALADALAKLLVSREMRERMGEKSRKLAEERFTIQRVVQTHLDVYSELSATH
ncbi:glycosyltransferase family 4 protein [bacterium]|nr:glycosyltransferase family 4 protein [bacterium]